MVILGLFGDVMIQKDSYDLVAAQPYAFLRQIGSNFPQIESHKSKFARQNVGVEIALLTLIISLVYGPYVAAKRLATV